MALEDQVSALVSAANNLTGVVSGKVSEIDQRMVSAEGQFDAWRQLKDVVGEPNWLATMRMNVFQGRILGSGVPYGVGGDGHFANKVDDLGQSNNIYIHFKTPMNINTTDKMFWFNIRGYSYGTAQIIDETIVGYAYRPQGAIISKSSFGTFSPDSYSDPSGNVVLRILIPNLYLTTIRIDTMDVSGTGVFPVGSLDVRVSLVDEVDFG